MVMQPPARIAERTLTARDGPTSKEALQRLADDILSQVDQRILAAVRVIRHEQDQLFDRKVRELKQEFDRRVKSLQEAKVTEFQSARQEMQEWLNGVGNSYHQKFLAVREELVTSSRLSADDAAIIAGRVTKSLGEGFDQSIKELSIRLESVAERADAGAKSLHEMMVKEFDDRVDLLSKSYENGIETVKTLLELLRNNPAVINVQPSSVEVKNLVETPKFDVIVPQQAPPVVNVSPELKSADVVVNVPPIPARRKRFSYDDTGRPLEVIEENVEE